MKLRWIEFALLYVGAPLFLAVGQASSLRVKIPIIPALIVITIAVLLLLRRDKNFEFAEFVRVRTVPRREWLWMLARFAIASTILTVWLWHIRPDALLLFPKERPHFWLLVMCCYPIFSVMAQGVIYRALYWRRYSCLFPEEYKIIAGAAVFAFAHLPYANVYALVFTFAGGLVFLSTYRRTRSNMFASIEHALFGDFLFTIGWGNFFFHGR